MKAAILRGGSSLERQVSLRSGQRVEEALAALGHDVVPLDADGTLIERLKAERPDVAFIALHGPGGEDGTVQELLEVLGIPYTGPGVASCIHCLDKVLAKHTLRDAGIATPDWVAITSTGFRELRAAEALDEIEARLGFPLVVKPAAQGSALGVRFAADRDDVPEALVSALSYDDRVLLERYVPGRELAVGVLDGEPLPIVEVRPREADLFNYEARYEIGRTDYICPAELDAGHSDEVRTLAARAYEALGCEGFSRVDLMLAGDGPQVLEVEAVPGLTDTSLFPMAAEAAGLSFEDVCGRIVELALRRTPATA